MTELDYLKVAERMGWHLLDFAVSEKEFAKHFVFNLYRPQLAAALATYTSFKDWRQLNEVIRLDQRAVLDELEACLNQACEMDSTMDVYDMLAYIDVNEYAQFCFERLVAYVDNFHITVGEGQDEET